MDARALASPNLTVLLAGNKSDLTATDSSPQASFVDETQRPPRTPSSTSSRQSAFPLEAGGGSARSTSMLGTGTRMTATSAEGREVSGEETAGWAAKSNIPAAVEVSALTGDGVDELFNRLARIILTKIELGEIDPDDPQSGIQYGDGGLYGHASDASSAKSGFTLDDGGVQLQHRGPKRRGAGSTLRGGLREWEDVFRLNPSRQRRGQGCC